MRLARIAQQGHERDEHEEEDIEEQQRPVGAPDPLEARVVVDPHDPDRHEGDGVGGVLRPRVRERRPEGGAVASAVTSMISSVAAIAKTPSAKASSRVVRTTLVSRPWQSRSRRYGSTTLP